MILCKINLISESVAVPEVDLITVKILPSITVTVFFSSNFSHGQRR